MNKLDQGIERCFQVTKKTFAFFNAVMVTVLVGVVIVDVFSSLLKFPIIITAELTGLMFAWITALSGVLIAIDDENIALTFVKNRFSPKARFYVDSLIDLVCLVFSGIMFKASVELNLEMYTQRMPLFGFSKVALYASMALMFGLIAVVLILNLIRRFVRRKEASQ